jgi:hypothetical protein
MLHLVCPKHRLIKYLCAEMPPVQKDPLDKLPRRHLPELVRKPALWLDVLTAAYGSDDPGAKSEAKRQSRPLPNGQIWQR